MILGERVIIVKYHKEEYVVLYAIIICIYIYMICMYKELYRNLEVAAHTHIYIYIYSICIYMRNQPNQLKEAG